MKTILNNETRIAKDDRHHTTDELPPIMSENIFRFGRSKINSE